MEREAAKWLEMCGWDTLAVTIRTTEFSTAACHVMQGFVDRCAELQYVYKDWRITTRCGECAGLLSRLALLHLTGSANSKLYT